MFRNRRRPRYGGIVVIITALFLLLLTVSLLHSRLNNSTSIHPHDAVPLPPLLHHTDSDVDYHNPKASSSSSASSYYFDHTTGVVRRAYARRSIEDWEDYVPFDAKLRSELGFEKPSFGSDDIRSVVEVDKIEDALLLKGSPLREGWGEWFDKKSDFLRRDKMFKSNLEGLNPMSNPLLQDPDAPGVTGFTRGDKIITKAIIKDFKRLPLSEKKSADVEGSVTLGNRKSGLKRAERRTLEDGTKSNTEVAADGAKLRGDEGGNVMNDFSGQIHADGMRWGYFPGLDVKLSFSEFVDVFFSKGNCSMRVYMVWNSPSWAYGVRHQRVLESILFHHPDACVLVLSETIELNFFHDFVRQGFKVAVAMPNLDELLKDTPTHIFASLWYEWKQTKHYPVHYSELIRLAVLYKYGGIYLDSDIIVLKPMSSLRNTVGMDDEQDGSTLNGAVMASDKHSHFIMECLKEFYASYDDTNLRWNGADLLSRVAGNLSSSQNHANKVSELMLLPSSVSFPITRKDIPRYFEAPKTEMEKSEQDNSFEKILREYVTFHFWNSETSALIPEPNSLVARILNTYCIRCSDVT